MKGVKGRNGARSIAALFMIALSCDQRTEHETAALHERLTSVDRVLGFESVAGDWALAPGSSGVLSSDPQHTEGAASARVGGLGWAQIQSTTPIGPLGPTSNTASFDVMVLGSGTIPWGDIILQVQSTTLGLNAQLGQKLFGGTARGAFQTVTFPLSSTVVTKLSSTGYNDLAIRVIANLPSGSSLVVDHLSFGQPPGASGGTGGTAGSGGVAGSGGTSAEAGAASGGDDSGAAGQGGVSGGSGSAGEAGGAVGESGQGGAGTAGNAGSSGSAGSGLNDELFIDLAKNLEPEAVVFGAYGEGGGLVINDGTRLIERSGAFSNVSSVLTSVATDFGAGTEVGDVYSTPNVFVRGSHVYGDLTTSGTLVPSPQLGSTIDGSISEGASLAPVRHIAWTAPFRRSPGAIDVPEGGSQSLLPGTYAGVVVGRDATLTLATPGIFSIDGPFVMEPGSVLELANDAGQIEIYVRENFTFRGSVQKAAPRNNFLIGVLGDGDQPIERRFDGILVAPYGSIQLGTVGEGHLTSLFGRSILARPHTTITHAPFDPETFCEGPRCQGLCPMATGITECQPGEPCDQDSDCSGGLACQAGLCGGCTRDLDCNAGAVCTNGACGVPPTFPCSSDAQCPSGYVCGTNNGGCFGRARSTRACWPAACEDGVSASECGQTDSPCGQNCACVTPCNADDPASTCPGNEQCKRGFGGLFLSPSRDVCVDVTCPSDDPELCGAEDKLCGWQCIGTSDCSTATCEDPGDGAGSDCPAVCDDGEPCTADRQCQFGSVCMAQSDGTRRCRPETCVMQALRPPLCGTSDATCDPQCPASCADRECGADPLSGAACGSCAPGAYCSGAGRCETPASDPPPTVPDPTTGDPVPVPELPGVSASGVGALAGSFSVTDRGSPQYTVPIDVPPGRAGLEPAISLQYNGSRQSGDLGMGWHLDGLSQVTRCPKVHALDGYAAPIQGDPSDFFCIDGKRLIAVPAGSGSVAGTYGADGTEYRTMIDSFAKIISHNETGNATHGPDYFEVYTKDGRILTFGRTPDSVSTDLNGSRQAWLLSRIEDRATNTVLFTYESFVSQAFGTGASVRTMRVRPSVITYTGHGGTPGNREVRFTYEPRPDTTLAFFQGGAGSVSNERLKRITTYVKGQPVKNYSITYRDGGPSQIEKVFECAGADESRCKQPTKFEYNAEIGFELSTSPEDLNLGEQLDINGDGLPDFVVTTIDHPGVPVDKTKKSIKLAADITATALAFVPTPATRAISLVYTVASPAIWNGGHLPGPEYTNELFVSTGQRCPLNDPDCTAGPVRSLGAIPNNPFLRGDATHVFDFDRDGKDDVAMLYFREQGAGPTMVLQLSAGDGTFSNYSDQPIPIIENGSPFFGDQARAAPMVFDVDGDGLEDLLTCGDRRTLELRLRLGPTLNTPGADFGPAIQLKPDQFDTRPILPCGNQASPYNIFDLDGDGTLDLLARDDFDDTGVYAEFGKWRVLRFSRASDGTPTLEWKPVRFEDWGSASGGSALGDRLVLGDFNGDGLLDVSRTEGSQIRIWLNTGNASFLAKDLARPVFNDMTFEASALLDHNGDGRTDILEGYRFGNNASPCGITHRPVVLSPDSTASALTQAEPAGMTWLREDPVNGTVCAQGADFTASGDVDGDGNIDLFASNSVLYGSGLRHALLSRVEDGLGNVIQVRYDEPGTYQADCQSPTWPEACMPKVTGLVSSYSEGFVPVPSTPVTVERTYKQQYFNGRKSVTGHGWLGFDKRVETRYGSGQTLDGSSVPFTRTITTEFWPVARYTPDGQPISAPVTPGQRYVYPLASMPKTVTIDQDVGSPSEIRDGGAVRRTVIDNDWRVGLSASSLPYPRIRYRTTRTFDLPAQSSAADSTFLITQHDEDFRYEDGGYGNVTHHYESFIPYPEWSYERRSTISTYAPDPTSWLVSNPRVTVLNSSRVTTLEDTSPVESQTQRWDFAYDPRGLLTSISRAFDGTADQQHGTTYLRNQFGNPYQIIESVSTTRDRRVTGIAYDSDAIFPLTITDPLGHVTQVRFDERWGTNTAVIDPNHIVVQQAYDDLGLLAEQSGPDGKTAYSYSPEFLAVPTYGPIIPPTGLIYPRVRVTIEQQGTAGTRGGGAVAEFDYRGRIVRTRSEGLGGTEVVAEQVYDALGRTIARTLPHTEAAEMPFSFFSYDGLNRLTRVDHSDQTFMTREYASRVSLSAGFHHWIDGVDCGTSYLSESECIADITRTTDETGRQSVVATDYHGLVMRSIDGEHVATTSRSSNYFYGAFNRLIKTRDNGGNTTSFEYDTYGRQVGVTTPNAGSQTYTYNGHDELTTSFDAKNQLRTYRYDDLGRLKCIIDGTVTPTTECIPGATGTTTWEYDQGPNAIGRLSAMISPGTAENPSGQRIDYTYEAVTAQNRGFLGRIDYRIDGVDYPIAYNYDDLGRIATVEYPDLGNGPTVRLKYGYDTSGVLNKAERVEVGTLNTDPLWLLDEMFQGHLVQKETLGNGATTQYAYNGARRWLEGIQTTLGPQTVQDIGYTHYANGLVQYRTDRIDATQTRQRHFDYDALNRLSASTDRNADNEVTDLSLHRYDHLGRITLRDTSTTTYATLTNHRIATVDSNNYSYDLNGNVDERSGPDIPGEFQEIDYTPFDLPSSITTGLGQSASTTRFEYSADEQRLVRRDPEKFRHFVPGLYERVALSVGVTLEERFRLYAGGREVAQLIRKPGEPDQIQYLHQDHLGTIDTVSFDNGSSVRQEFDPFGKHIDPPSPELTRAGFTGQAHDRDLGLVDYGGRIYDPLAAQFMQPDPIMQAPYFSQGLNPYAYVFNDPVNHTDPSGFTVADMPGGWGIVVSPDEVSALGLSEGSAALGSAGTGISAGTAASVAGGVAGGINVVNDVIDLASSAKWEVAPAKYTATPSAQSHRAQGATQPGPDAASQNKGGVGPRSTGTDNIGALPCNGTPEQCRQRAMDFNLGGGIAPGGVVVGKGGSLLSRLFGWLFGKGASKALPPAIEVVATKFGAKNAAIFERTIEIVAEKGGKRFVDHLAALAQAVGEKVPMGQVWKLGELGGKPIFGAVRNGLGIVETKAGTMIVHAPTGGTPTVIGPLLP